MHSDKEWDFLISEYKQKILPGDGIRRHAARSECLTLYYTVSFGGSAPDKGK